MAGRRPIPRQLQRRTAGNRGYAQRPAAPTTGSRCVCGHRKGQHRWGTKGCRWGSWDGEVFTPCGCEEWVPG